MKHDIMAFRFFTLSSSVHVKIGLKLRPIVSNRLYRFENTKTWHEVFVEVCDDDFFLREIDEICMTVSDLLIMGCNCSTYFKNRFLVFFFLVNISSAAVSRVPTLISSKRCHKYMYSRVSHVKMLFKKWIQ